MNIFSKVSLLGTSNLPKPWQPAFQSPELATKSNWQSITYGNGIYLAKSGKYFASSTDGITWGAPYEVRITAYPELIENLTTIAYGNGIFVAMGDGLAVSTTGANWRVPTSYSGPSDFIIDLIFDGQQFVALGNGYVYTSSDGSNWTRKGYCAGGITITYNGTSYITNFSTLNIGYISLSTDLINWTQETPVGISIDFIVNMCLGYDGSRFFGIYNGQISYSIDGINWTTPVTDSNLGNHNWKASTTNDIKTVLISSDGYISTKRV